MTTLSGALKHKITLQESKEIRGPYGGVSYEWKDVRSLYGRVYILKGDEEFDRMGLPQTVAGVHARIKIRRRNGLDSGKNRIKHGRTIYDILAILQDIDNRETQLLCVARATDQENGGGVNP